jgi:hypothetical protein
VQKLTKYPSRLENGVRCGVEIKGRGNLENGKWGQCAKIDKISGKWGQCAKIDKISVTFAHPKPP